jgi:hypothetical protein
MSAAAKANKKIKKYLCLNAVLIDPPSEKRVPRNSIIKMMRNRYVII